MMRDSFVKIAEAAKKESHTGYGDYAVFGGFSGFVEAVLKGQDDEQAQLLRGVVHHYADSNLKTRKAIIDLTLKLIHDFSQEEILENASAENGQECAPDAPIDRKDAPKESARETTNVKHDHASEKKLCYLKGVGPKKAALLQKLGLESVGDLCEYFPYRHEDRRFITEIASLYDGQSALVSGVIDRVELRRIRNNLQILKGRLTDESGALTVNWFNQPWLKQQLCDGREITVYGKVEYKFGGRVMNVAEYELKRSNEGFGILPVYGLTAGINQKTMRSLVWTALELCKDSISEIFPPAFLREHHLEERSKAVCGYHFPPDFETLQRCHHRLVFEEFLLFRLACGISRNEEVRPGISMTKGDVSDFFSLLPFAPTGAQRRVIDEIYRDMASAQMMNRLLEGDVGSGKTVVAAAAIYRCVENKHQAALMAPTEILAEQHYRSLTEIFAHTGIRITLLTGSVKTAEKKKIGAALRCGEIDLLIGTHALIEGTADFQDLALVIIDEQHRFGVNQRNALFMKGCSPDLLAMTATPIPRTLAMAVFSDLSLSVLDEMPPGRKPVKTMVITTEQEERAINFMKKHVAAGHQCYVVCPLVEETDKMDLEAATQYYLRLKDVAMKGISVGLVHGRMKGAEKEAVLEKFRKNEISVLVATTVIEIGIDVPNATVMFVKNAERFGLAQLHQIRGRIGRGKALSTCLLQSSVQSEYSMERLKVMEKYSDGFKIAEEDLKLRGPGDFFGVRQHGLPEMNLADLFRDHDLLTEAAAAADKILAADPKLEAPSWQKVKAMVEKKCQMKS